MQADTIQDLSTFKTNVFVAPALKWDGKEYDPEEDHRRMKERSSERK